MLQRDGHDQTVFDYVGLDSQQVLRVLVKHWAKLMRERLRYRFPFLPQNFPTDIHQVTRVQLWLGKACDSVDDGQMSPPLLLALAELVGVRWHFDSDWSTLCADVRRAISKAGEEVPSALEESRLRAKEDQLREDRRIRALRQAQLEELSREK